WDTLADLGITWPDGTYTVTVTATDAADNIGSDSITLTIDNTDPEAFFHVPVGGSFISDTTPMIGFDITDLGGGVVEDSIVMTVAGDSITPLEVIAITNGFHVEYSLGTSEALSEGSVIVTAAAIDEVGNALTLEIPIMNENVGTGTGDVADTFDLDYKPILESEKIYVDGTTQTRGTDYTIDVDGKITFTGSIPITGAIITADYDTETWSFTIDLTEPTMESAKADTKTEIDVTFGEELDPETVDATDFLVDGMVPSEVSVSLTVVTLTVAEMPTDATPEVVLAGDGVADLVGNVLTEGTLTATDEIEPEVWMTVSPDPTTTYATSGVKTIFTLTFSEIMNIATPPTVSYGLEAEYDAYPVTGSWISTTVWSAEYTGIPQDDDSDGLNTIKITGATDSNDIVMEADTANTFTIDTIVDAPTVTPTGTVYRT
ncbi:hypothetical protein LCGC14_2713140, partial [marine sediment metagenome]